MRTDAMFPLSNNNGTGKSRMDRDALEQLKNNVAPGFGVQGAGTDADSSKFQQMYDRIARENGNARGATQGDAAKGQPQPTAVQEALHRDASSGDAQPVKPGVVGQLGDATAALDDPATDVPGNAPTREPGLPGTDKNDAASDQASSVIADALAQLSNALGLNFGKDLSGVSFGSPNEDSKEQFAEILYTLKNISGLLDKSISDNQPLELGGKVLDVSRMQQMQQVVNTSQFQIEIALSQLGVSEDVSGKLAEKFDMPFSTGIPQASNPADLKMSTSQLNQVFQGAISDPQKEVAALAAQVRELVKDVQPGKPVTLNVTSSAPANNANVKTSDLAAFDTTTMRTLLNIDGKADAVKGENTSAAASNQKLNLLLSGQPIAKNISDLAENQQGDSNGAASILSSNGMMPGNNTGVEVKTAAPLPQLIENSLMTQIAGKVSDAVRTGITEVKMQLNPESLGEVQLKIRVQGDVVTAQIQVENQQVKHIIENNISLLKDSLAQQNLQTGSFEVNVGHGGQQDSQQALEDRNQATGPAGNVQSGADKSVDACTIQALNPGHDTGRRFGNNTVEFFA